jgi:hypothetical protein
MKIPVIAFPLAMVVLSASAAPGPEMAPPTIGKVQTMKASDLRPGMKATAWTVLQGTEPEPIPVEIMGLLKNMWGPGQDLIVGKMGGKAIRTQVAGGMSGSPVYIDGKLIGAVSLRFGAFSADPICGITPIDLMLEIKDFDATRPADAKAPGNIVARDRYPVSAGGDWLAQAVSGGGAPSQAPDAGPFFTPIETPITVAGFDESVLREFGPMFQQLGVRMVQGGAGGSVKGTKPVHNWQDALRPGDAVSGVLVDGDMNMTGMGTVTYNDGKRVLAFGHPFFNLGPVSMPMSKAEVLLTFGSQLQPVKFGNATEIVGALRQDRHSGIMGELGEEAQMVPVTVNVRSFADDGSSLRKERKLHFNVFVNQKWTPYLMMVTLFNSISGLNDFAEEATYRVSGKVELDGNEPLSLSTMLAPGEMPVPAPMLLAGWWGDKFNRLFLNNVQVPKLKSVNATVDLLPERRTAGIETAWIGNSEVDAGTEVPVKLFLRPYRGERIEKDFNVKIPAGLPKGEHRILLSDADTLNRMQAAAATANNYIDLEQTVSLINQERANNKVYVSLVQARPTVYYDDKQLPSLPASVLNVMQTGRTASRSVLSSAETAHEQLAIPFDQVISGSYSLKITVK